MISEKRELVFGIVGGPLCNCKVNELNAVNTGQVVKGPVSLPFCPTAPQLMLASDGSGQSVSHCAEN